MLRNIYSTLSYLKRFINPKSWFSPTVHQTLKKAMPTQTRATLGCLHQRLRPCPSIQCWQCTGEQEKHAPGSWKFKNLKVFSLFFIWLAGTCWPGRSWWTEQWAGSAQSCQRSGPRWRGSPENLCEAKPSKLSSKELFAVNTYNLFLGVLVGGEQVDGLHLAEVDVVAEQEDEEQFANIFLLLVTVQCLVPLGQKCKILEFYWFKNHSVGKSDRSISTCHNIQCKIFFAKKEESVQRNTDLELGPNVGQLLVDPLHLCLFALAVSEQGYLKAKSPLQISPLN